MKNYMAVLFALGFLFTAAAFARIGETPAQCETRLGKARVVDKDEELFIKDGWEILVHFYQGKADSQLYSKETGISDNEIKAFLAGNGGDKKWKNVDGYATVWQTEDGTLLAQNDGTTLFVLTKDRKARADAFATEQKAKGLVEYNGEWITPEVKKAQLIGAARTSGNITHYEDSHGNSAGAARTSGNITHYEDSDGNSAGEARTSGNTTYYYDSSGRLVDKARSSGNTTYHDNR